MNNVDEFIEYCDNVVMESQIIDEATNILNHLAVLYEHMLKWEFQADHRSRSWRGSIQNARQCITDIIKEYPSVLNYVTKDAMIEKYAEGLEYASSETGLSYDNFPSKIPKDWLKLEKLLDDKYFIHHMKNIDYYDPRGKDFDVENYFKLGKKKKRGKK